MNDPELQEQSATAMSSATLLSSYAQGYCAASAPLTVITDINFMLSSVHN